MNKATIIVAFLLLVVGLSAARLEVNLKKTLVSGEIIFEVTNNNEEPYRFTTYRTPFEDFIAADMFQVTSRDGRVMRYMGPVARRVSPIPPSARMELLPHNTLSVHFNISKYYEITTAGFYSISSKIAEFEEFNNKEVVVFLHENEENFQVSSDLAANKYTNCDATEKSQIDSATDTAITQATRAYNCMNANSCRTLSDTWFGTYSASNYDFDKSCFNNIKNNLNSNGINAYCNPAGCGNNVYAYVYPTDPAKTVYLCGAFWSQPGERANTIVHEMSHFNAIAGTEDYAYGRTTCKNLANSNPYQASHNADNVCYFSDEA